MSHITPKIAIEKGIGMVHQEFMLVKRAYSTGEYYPGI